MVFAWMEHFLLKWALSEGILSDIVVLELNRDGMSWNFVAVKFLIWIFWGFLVFTLCFFEVRSIWSRDLSCMCSRTLWNVVLRWLCWWGRSNCCIWSVWGDTQDHFSVKLRHLLVCCLVESESSVIFRYCRLDKEYAKKLMNCQHSKVPTYYFLSKHRYLIYWWNWQHF